MVACTCCVPISHTPHPSPLTLTHTHTPLTPHPHTHTHLSPLTLTHTHTSHTHTHTHTPLTHTHTVGCDVFNFSLSGIGNSELAIRSDLHLYMTRKRASNDRLTVEIRKYHQDNNGEDFITSKEILPNEETGWLVFPMQAYVSRLIPEGEFLATSVN